MQSGKPLVTKLPISATVYELKAELQSLLNIEPETLEISASDVTCADSDLLIEVAGLGKNKQIKPVVSCYEGNNFVGLILFSLGGEDFADQVSKIVNLPSLSYPRDLVADPSSHPLLIASEVLNEKPKDMK
ncbi:uncharacterized protein LOC124462067 [Drosophila willistoni]|uniref:uncharacterized protein LOC124462067 n=1 Tax=Drosophila willistoni TaxID=7260 RepID=UPI001F077FBE|nr:uncharacterized protein LOC124462067 [Drosophila willistoni]